MSNPIQQAIEALEMARRFVYADNRPQCEEAIAALQSLQGVELPPLPEPYTELYKDLTPVLYEAWSQQMQAYARTAVAAAMARGAVARVKDDMHWQDVELLTSLVNSNRIAPSESSALFRLLEQATQPDPLEKLTRLQEDMGLYDEATQPTQAEGRPCKVGGPCVSTATSLCACRELPPATQPTQAEAPSTEGLLKRASRALMIAEGALIEVSPCAEEGCRQHQTDIMRIAEEECAAVRVLIEATLATQPTQAEAPSVTTSQTIDDLIADSERERKSAAEWQQWVERGGYDGGQQAEVPSVAALFKEAAKNIYHADDNGLSAWERRNVRELSMMLKAFKAALATQQAGQGEAVKDLVEAVDTLLDGAPCDCPHKRRFEDGEHFSHCYLFDLNIARAALLATPPAPQQPEALAQQERDFMDESVSPAEREAIARLHRKVRR